MLNLSIASPAALRSAAARHLEKMQLFEAEQCLTEALRRNINDDAALSLVAQMYLIQDRLPDAFSYYVLAVNANPSVFKNKQKLTQVAANIPVNAYNPITDNAIVEVLKSAHEIDCAPLRLLWLTHVLTIPDFNAAFALDGRAPFEPANKAHFDNIADFKPFLLPVVLLGVENFVVYNQVFEEFIGAVRRHLLNDLGKHEKLTREEFIKAVSAIAHYSFNTDYILYASSDENARAEELQKRIEGGERDVAALAMLACYKPLYKLANRASIPEWVPANSEPAKLVRLQIADYETLKSGAESVEAITTIDDAVSLKVREQYEEFPYPKWKSVPDTTILGGLRLNGQASATIGARLSGPRTRILNAGCGTGMEATAFAVTFPDSKVLAVDLSRASLAYAGNKAKEFGIGNIQFRQADILKLGALDQKFDCIVSGGVLHHIKDPVAAWRILTGLLKDDGYMMIGLYSKIARREIMKAHEIIAKGSCANDADSMRAFRQKPYETLGTDIYENVCRFADYYYLNMYRDMLFHVQEKNYDLPEIKAILNELGLEFSGFWRQDAIFADYDAMFQGDPLRVNLDNWHAFEQKNPATFAGMYVFWCKKKAA